MKVDEVFILSYSITGVLLMLMLILGLYFSKRNERQDRLKKDFTNLRPGDVFECKSDVNKMGFSKSNPFEQSRCEIINKKDGWVSLKFYNNNSTQQMSFEKFIKLGYKYIYNVNNRNL